MGVAQFEIYPVEVGTGQIALSPIPGRSGSYEADISALLRWAPDMVLTMTTGAELDRMGAAGLGNDLAALGVAWHHLPIVDFGAPDAHVRAVWPRISTQAHELLARGGRILIHCFGGCGRSGMAALRLMIEAGATPAAGLARLREARPCAVETDEQYRWAASAAV